MRKTIGSSSNVPMCHSKLNKIGHLRSDEPFRRSKKNLKVEIVCIAIIIISSDELIHKICA
jgi:hypothetical protein